MALTREEGKTRIESRREVIRSIELFQNFMAARPGASAAICCRADTPHTLLYSARVPVGVAAIITPWNFPLSIPVWKIAPALVGNTRAADALFITPSD